jgi:hypothetical protein
MIAGLLNVLVSIEVEPKYTARECEIGERLFDALCRSSRMRSRVGTTQFLAVERTLVGRFSRCQRDCRGSPRDIRPGRQSPALALLRSTMLSGGMDRDSNGTFPILVRYSS